MRLIAFILLVSCTSLFSQSGDTSFVIVPKGMITVLTVCPELQGQACDDGDDDTYGDSYYHCKCIGEYDPNEDVSFTGMGSKLSATGNDIENISSSGSGNSSEFYGYSTKKLPANTDGWIEFTSNEMPFPVNGYVGFTTSIGHPSGTSAPANLYSWYISYSNTSGINGATTVYASSGSGNGSGQNSFNGDDVRVFRIERKSGEFKYYINGVLEDTASVLNQSEMKLFVTISRLGGEFNNCKISEGWISV